MSSENGEMPVVEGEEHPPAYYAGFGAGVWDSFRDLLDPPSGDEPFGADKDFNEGYHAGWEYAKEHYPPGRPPRPVPPA